MVDGGDSFLRVTVCLDIFARFLPPTKGDVSRFDSISRFDSFLIQIAFVSSLFALFCTLSLQQALIHLSNLFTIADVD